MWTRISKAGLVCGFLSLSLAISVSLLSPATEYEYSIYSATPKLFWSGCGIAFIVSIIVLLLGSRTSRCTAGILGSLAMISISALPLIRGYYYYGNRDGLSHLGLVKSIISNSGWFELNVYPAVHLDAATMTLVTGLSPRVTLLILLSAFVGLFFLSITILTRSLHPAPQTAPIALISSWMLLPLMAVRLPRLYPIPNTIALFLAPIILAFLVKFIISQRLRFIVVVFLIGLLSPLFHPTLSVFITLVIAAGWITSKASKILNLNISRHIGIAPVFLAIALAAFSWTASFESKLEHFARSWLVVSSGFGGDISSAGSSLAKISTSLPELAARIGTVKAIFIVLSLLEILFMVSKIHNRNASVYQHAQLTIASAFVPLGGMVALFLVLGISNQWSRYAGYLMILATVFGAIALAQTLEWRPHSRTIIISMSCLLILLLGVTIPIIHPSPLIVRPNQQVTKSQYYGYKYIFEFKTNTAKVTGVYTKPHTFRNAILGTVTARRGIGVEKNFRAVSFSRPKDHFATWLENESSTSNYLMLTDEARKVHLKLYQSEVQTQHDLHTLNQYKNRIYDNGDATLFF